MIQGYLDPSCIVENPVTRVMGYLQAGLIDGQLETFAVIEGVLTQKGAPEDIRTARGRGSKPRSRVTQQPGKRPGGRQGCFAQSKLAKAVPVRKGEFALRIQR